MTPCQAVAWVARQGAGWRRAGGPRARRTPHAAAVARPAFAVPLGVLLLTCCWCAAGVSGASVVIQQAPGAQGAQLLAALQNASVTDIQFAGDYAVGSAFDPYIPTDATIKVNRNITLRGLPGARPPPVLDLHYRQGVVEMCDACWVVIRDMAIANERMGANAQVDIFLGNGNSVLWLDSVVRLREVCTPLESALTVVGGTRRSPRFPGPAGGRGPAGGSSGSTSTGGGARDGSARQVYGAEDVVFRGQVFPRMLRLFNFSVEYPRQYSGGYHVGLRNVSRVCRSYAAMACLAARDADICVAEAIMAKRAADDAAAAAAASQQQRRLSPAATAGVAVAVAAAAAAAMGLAAGVCWRRRRARQRGEAAAARGGGPRKHPDLEAAGGGGAAGGGDVGDDVRHARDAGKRSSCVRAGGGGTTTGRARHDGSARGLAAAGGAGAAAVAAAGAGISDWSGGLPGPPLPAAAAAQAQPASGASLHSLSGAGTALADLTWGKLLGTGSFGRVYQARWGARDVAVKIIEHDSSMSAVVANEVALMLSCKHPNVVAAYHFVTRSHTQHHTGRCSLQSGSGSTGGALPAPASGGVGGAGGGADGGDAAAAAAALGGSAASPPQQPPPPPSSSGFHSSASNNFGVGGGSAGTPRGATTAGHASGSCSGSARTQRSSGSGGLRSHVSPRPAFTLASASDVDKPVPVIPGPRTPGPPPPLFQAAALGEGSPPRSAAAAVAAAAAAIAAAQVPAAPAAACAPAAAAGACSTLQHLASAGHAQQQQQQLLQQQSSLLCNHQGGFWPAGPPLVHEGDHGLLAGQGAEEESELVSTWLVLELCDGGTLAKHTSAWPPAGRDEGAMLRLLLLLRDVARGLDYLHSRCIVHGDLNARNVLVASSAASPIKVAAKLADLGLSRCIKQHGTHHTTCTVGTMSAMPPELLKSGRLSCATDIYSYAIMMWELFAQQVAFRELHYGQFFETVVLRNQRPPVPPDMPSDYRTLMERCWAAGAPERPSAAAILACLQLMIEERELSLGGASAAALLALAGPGAGASAAPGVSRRVRYTCHLQTPTPLPQHAPASRPAHQQQQQQQQPGYRGGGAPAAAGSSGGSTGAAAAAGSGRGGSGAQPGGHPCSSPQHSEDAPAPGSRFIHDL